MLFFAVVTGVAEIFAVVTVLVFADVTTIANQIFFDDVTANPQMDGQLVPTVDLVAATLSKQQRQRSQIFCKAVVGLRTHLTSSIWPTESRSREIEVQLLKQLFFLQLLG